MSDRLSSQEFLRAYDAGIHHIRRAKPEDSDQIRLVAVDLKALAEHPDCRSLVPAVPARDLYLSMKQQGITDCADVLQHVSAEQVRRFCDYDTWRENRLVPKQILSWMMLFRSLSPEQMFQRFRELDEEYQIACMSPLIRGYDGNQYEGFSHEMQDRLCSFPGGELYYEICTDDPEIIQAIEELLSVAMGFDMQYAMSLVAHASFDPPNEAEHTLLQFRRARLEEDGFVDFDEARAVFFPIDVAKLVSKWSKVTDQDDDALTEAFQNESFLQLVLERCRDHLSDSERHRISQSLMHLCNTLAAATGLEPDDIVGLRHLMTHSSGLVSIGLEFLSNQDAAKAAIILREEHPRVLFQVALSIVRDLQADLVEAMDASHVVGMKSFKDYWSLQKFAKIQDWLDAKVEWLGSTETEALKAFFNRFPMVADHRDTTSKNILTFRAIRSMADTYRLMILTDFWRAKFHLSSQVNPSKEGLLTTPPRLSSEAALFRVVANHLLNRSLSSEWDDSSLEKLRALNAAQLREHRSSILTSLMNMIDPDSWYRGFSLTIRTTEQAKRAFANTIKAIVYDKIEAICTSLETENQAALRIMTGMDGAN